MQVTALDLWRRPMFRRFWAGETISFLGNQITDLALPLTAVLLLGATAEQMGVLAATWYLPYLVFGLPAGVWIDRMRRQRILVGLDLTAAAVVLIVPVAAWAHMLRMELLYVVSFVLGSTVVVFTVAYQSFVPTLVGRSDIAAANAALETTTSITTIAGPGLGGLLVQVLMAPFALLVDAASFLVSAALIGSIRVTEPASISAVERRSMLEEIRDGVRYVRGTPVLFALVRGGAIHNFFSRMIDALFVLFAVRQLTLDATTIGLILAAGGPGSFIGSLIANRVPARIGLGRTIAAMQLLTAAARVLIPLAAIGGGPVASAAILAASMFGLGLVRTVFNVNQLSLRLAITEDRMHGRLNATMRFVMWGVTPFGALAGGLLATTPLGVSGTLILGAVGCLVAALPFLLPAIRTLRSIPSSVLAAER